MKPKVSVFLLSAMVIVILWLAYFITSGYHAQSDRVEADIVKILFEARRNGTNAGEVVRQISQRHPFIEVKKIDPGEQSMLQGFSGYICISPPVTNHVSSSYQWMLWIESDENDRLVAAWRNFRFPVKGSQD